MAFDVDDDHINSIVQEQVDSENEALATQKNQRRMLKIRRQTVSAVHTIDDKQAVEIAKILDKDVRKDLEEKLDIFANNIYNFAQELNRRKVTIKEQFDSLVKEAREKNVPSEILSKMMRIALHRKGVSESYIRKIMPEELKKTIHTNIRYLQKQTTYDALPTNELGKPIEAIPLSSDAIITEENESVQQVPEVPEREELPGQIKEPVPIEVKEYLHQDIPQTTQEIEHIPVSQTIRDLPKVDYMDQMGRFYKQNVDTGKLEEIEISSVDAIRTMTTELLVKTKQINSLEVQVTELRLELKDLKHILKDDSFTSTGYLTLKDNDIPVRVSVNIKEKKIESIEIDNDAIKTAQMSQ